MNRRTKAFCSWLVAFCFLFVTLSPEDALAFFDTNSVEDSLKTTGIIIGITFGVALVVVLVVGTVRDLKKGKDQDDDEVWTRNPLLRTLGYRPGDTLLFGEAPSSDAAHTVMGSAGWQEIDLFLEGRVDRIGLENTHFGLSQDLCGFTSRFVPSDLTLSNPPTAPEIRRPRFSLWQPNERS